MAFKIKEGLIVNTTEVFDDSASLLVNAPTATALETARSIALSGDATGSASFDGTSDVTIAVTIPGLESGSFSGDVTGDVFASDGTSKILENGTDGTDATFQGDLLATDGSTTVLTVGDGVTAATFTGNVTGNVTGDLTGNADTATALETAQNFSITGDVVASAVSFDGTGNVVLNATIQPDSVALGTDTTGDYVESVGVTAGTGLSVTGTGEGATVTLAGVDATNATKGVASFNSNDFSVTSGAVSIAAGGVSNTQLVNDSVTVGTTEIVLGTAETALSGLTQINIDNLRLDGNTISSTNIDGDVVISPNGAGVINASTSRITNVSTPTAATDAANKQYVDDTAQGLRTLPSAEAFSDSNLSANYDNGTDGVGATLTATTNGAFPTIDGVTLSQGDNIIINGQTNKAHNGSYELTTVGDASNPWVLTRSTFDDEADEQAGSFEFVTNGTVYADTGWVMTVGSTPVVMGTTELEWVQFSGAGSFTAGDGLSLVGTEFSVNVDDSTIEIVGDVLQVKDSGITNAKLENDHFTVATNGTGADFDIQLGDTWNFDQGEGIDITIGTDTVTIAAELASDTNAGVASFAAADFAVDGAGAVTISDVTLGTQTSGDYVATIAAGTGINVTGAGTEGRAATVELNHLGIENLVDPDADRILFWDDSAGNTDWLTVGSGLDLTGSTIINDDPGSAQNIFKTVTVGSTDIVADSNDDTLTFVAGANITLTADAGTDTITIASASSGDSAFDTVTDTVAASSTEIIDTFDATLFRSAKYFVQVDDGTNYQVSEVMAIHDGTNADIIEYGVLEMGTAIGDVGVNYNSGTIEITFANASTTTASVTIKRVLIEI